jgi:hypothetical protein
LPVTSPRKLIELANALRARRETDVESAEPRGADPRPDGRPVCKPVGIVAFNTTEGWARDVTVEIADELRRRDVEFGEVPDSVLDFMEANRR